MHTPTVALAWELWRRHRLRLIAIVSLLLGFVLFYPNLCALAGFNLDSQDGLGEILSRSTLRSDAVPSSFQLVVHVVYIIFLACGPVGTMFLSLLGVAWMFTFTTPDQKTKDPLAFPTRLFTLPISTPFLFWWLVLAGQAGLAGHLKIGDGVQIGAQSGVMQDVGAGEKVLGAPAQDPRDFMRQIAAMRRLPDLLKKVAALEKKLNGE